MSVSNQSVELGFAVAACLVASLMFYLWVWNENKASGPIHENLLPAWKARWLIGIAFAVTSLLSDYSVARGGKPFGLLTAPIIVIDVINWLLVPQALFWTLRKLDGRSD